MSKTHQDLLFQKFTIIKTLKKDEHTAVYLAHHEYLGKQILLKTMDTSKISDQSVIERFKREAKLLARLEHPNIIKVLDFGAVEHELYISFEFFESKNLRTVLKERELSLNEKRDIFVQLVQGLATAHQNQIIHRDIKPENILISQNLQLKIADFGLAFAENEMMVTSKSSILGTPGYMSPEQIRGEQLNARSDLFSLGIAAYELFTGTNPFVKSDLPSTINALLNFDDSIFEPLQILPEELQTIIRGLLQKSKNKRITSAKDVLSMMGVEAYEPLLASGTFPQPLTPKKRVAIIYGIPALIIVMITAVYFGFFYNKNITDNPVTQNPSTMLNSANGQPNSTNQNVNNQSVPPNTTIPKDQQQQIPEVIPSQLSVDCLQWGTLYIDGREIDKTPLQRPVSLQPGRHTIKLINPRYPVFDTVVYASTGKNLFVRVNFELLVGYLNCNIIPWGEVYVDGTSYGLTPVNVMLATGKHLLRLNNPKFGDYEKTITIKRGETLEVDYKFEAAKEPQ